MLREPEMSSLAVHDNWDRHWDDYASSAERNPAQRYRRKLILSSLGLNQAASTPRVLDIGSGQGDFAADLLAACPDARVLGLELSASGIEIAARKVPGAEFLQCDLTQPHEPPPGRQAWATHAVCSEVLEHVDDPERLLVNAQPWMAPTCKLIVTVPGGPMSAFDKHIGHRKHYRPEDLRCLLERAGFRVDLASGAGYPFFDLYRRVVIARGSRLIGDVSRKPSPAARTAMGVFDALFRLNVHSRGWQTFAIATYRT
jgi:SAM-dependent methyltransferase